VSARDDAQARQAKFEQAYYGFLLGATCTKVEFREGEFAGERWPLLHFRKPDGVHFEVEVSQDPEGNGPGFLFGLPVPELADETEGEA